MTKEERSLKIMKIERYKNDLSGERKRYTECAILLCWLAVNSVCIFGGDLSSLDQFYQDIMPILGKINVGAMPLGITALVHSICRKTNLESKIKDIELELEFDDMSQGSKKI